MKKYKPSLKEYSKLIYFYRGHEVFDVEHSVERFRERFPELSIRDYNKALEEGINIILDILKDSSGKYFLESKSKHFAIQFDWSQDKKKQNKINCGKTATTLDARIHKKELQKDRRLFVEDFKKNHIETHFTTTSFKEIIKQMYYYGRMVSEECKDYKVYIQEGKVKANYRVIKVK